MEVSDTLFQLIQTLTLSEKRYFKLFSGLQKGDKLYLKLFDAIERQAAKSEKDGGPYDEKKIIASFGKASSIKHLPALKNKLYRRILKSLESFQSSAGPEAKLHGLLNNIKILFGKELYKQCEPFIEKGKQIARDYDEDVLLLQFMKWELRIFKRRGYAGKTEEEIEQHHDAFFTALEECRSASSYGLLVARSWAKIGKVGHIRTQADKEAYEELMLHPLMKAGEQMAVSYAEKLDFWTVYTNHLYATNSGEKLVGGLLKLVAFLEKFPHKIAYDPTSYISALNRLILCQGSIGKHRQQEESIEKLKKIIASSPQYKKRISLILVNNQLCFYGNRGQIEKGLDLIKETKSQLQKWGEKAKLGSKTQEWNFHYWCFHIHFLAGQFGEANKHINSLASQPDQLLKEIRSDVYYMVAILRLILCYEAGKDNLLEYMIRSTYRYLYKRKKVFRFETAFLDFLRKDLSKVNSEKELIEAFKKLKVVFEALLKDDFEKNVFFYFDFISWLESKIENRPLAEIIREKAAKFN